MIILVLLIKLILGLKDKRAITISGKWISKLF